MDININYKKILVIFLLFIIIDVPVITKLNVDMYSKQFNRINQEEMKMNLTKWLFAIICYLLLAFGLYHFVIKNNNDDTMTIAKNGFIFGLVVYGIYNATNKVTINKWGVIESFVDTAWGSVLSATIAVLASFIIKNFLKIDIAELPIVSSNNNKSTNNTNLSTANIVVPPK